MNTQAKVIGAIGILTVIILVGGVWVLGSQNAKEQTKLAKPLAGEVIADQGANHVPAGTKVEYNSNPPTSGPHYATSQPAGIYDSEIPDGNLIHSMEHGAVILWYKPAIVGASQEATESSSAAGLSKPDIDRLRQIFSSVPVSKKIMVPRQNLDVPLALTSWGRLLKLRAIDEAQIKNFMETNEDRGPEKAPL